MPTTPGAVQPRYAGDAPQPGQGGLIGGDCHVAHLSAEGSRLLAATFFGGSRQERNVYGMGLTRGGDVVVCSTTRSPDLPTTEGAYQRRFGGGTGDWFAARLTPDLRTLVWCTYVGGSGGESPRGGLAIGPQDEVYLVGQTESPDFPTTAGTFQPRLKGSSDAAVVKLKADGSALLYSTLLGGTRAQNEGIIGASLDRGGGICLGGHTDAEDFPITPGAPQPRCAGQTDCFIARLAAGGDRLLSATYLGGSGPEFAEHRLALGPAGAMILTGFTGSADFPTTPVSFQRRTTGPPDGFVAGLSRDGKRLLFSTYLGGSGTDFWLMPTCDSRGNIWVVGETSSPDLPTTLGALQPRPGGKKDGALAILSPDGARLLYLTYLGGSGDDFIRSLALGPRGAIYLVGNTNSSDFPVTPGAFQTKPADRMGDCFVVKLVPR